MSDWVSEALSGVTAGFVGSKEWIGSHGVPWLVAFALRSSTCLV